MPEGDSYTRAADRLRPVLVDRELTHVDGTPAVRKWSDRLVGHTVTAIRTHGKHLLFDVDSGVTIHVWLGMPGRWRIRDATGRTVAVEAERRRGGRTRDPRGAARLILGTEHHEATCYAAPTVEIERTRVIDRLIDRLGPDVLADEFDWDLFHDRASKVQPERAVTDVLLDQRVLAGVGNEYKNEVMFLERLHPLTPFGSLDADRRPRRPFPPAHAAERPPFRPGDDRRQRRGDGVVGVRTHRQAVPPVPHRHRLRPLGRPLPPHHLLVPHVPGLRSQVTGGTCHGSRR